MKKLRFTVELNYSERDEEWFYDVVDHHMLRDRRVVGWYTAAKEMADYMNDKYGYEFAMDRRMNLKKVKA